METKETRRRRYRKNEIKYKERNKERKKETKRMKE
jgi:hypothetical protein